VRRPRIQSTSRRIAPGAPIALDTNVLLRFLLDDDKAQSARAARLVDDAVEADEPLFVSDVVLCETARVLVAAYRVRKKQVGVIVGRLLLAAHLRSASA